MSEPRKNHLTIDGGQVKEDDHASSYKPIPESDTELRSSKGNLTKSKEKVSDEAEEKLLQKEDEAKITTRVDMADAKYVVGDHRNGDAKIELDANKKQFSGLTKEELLKYAEDPFWVRLRWFMFILFWALWLAMLAGAITIIVRAPKCAAPKEKTWFERGPLLDANVSMNDLQAAQSSKFLQASKVAGVFLTPCSDEETYQDLETLDCFTRFKEFVAEFKKQGVKVIVDLTANYVPKSHPWFVKSENQTGEYKDYFVWGKSKDSDGVKPLEPNNWVAVVSGKAWAYSAARNEYYLHRYGADKPDLNFNNEAVVAKFQQVLTAWMKAGADGIRLNHARLLVVNTTDLTKNEDIATGRGSDPGAVHDEYRFYTHAQTADQPALQQLLARWMRAVDDSGSTPGAGETVFTLAEDGELLGDYYALERNVTLRPPSASPALVAEPNKTAYEITKKITKWAALQLKLPGADSEESLEIASFAMLLPAAPVLDASLLSFQNDTKVTEAFERVTSLRGDATIAHGNCTVAAVPSNTTGTLLAVARWKKGHTGYAAVFNPTQGSLVADLSRLPAVPAKMNVFSVTPAVQNLTSYDKNTAVTSDSVTVPAKATVVLNFVPKLDQ